SVRGRARLMCPRVDAQKSAPARFALRPVTVQLIVGPVVEDVIDVLISPRVYRIVAFHIRPPPAGEHLGSFAERAETFLRGRVAQEIIVKGGESFGIEVQFTPSHHLASL